MLHTPNGRIAKDFDGIMLLNWWQKYLSTKVRSSDASSDIAKVTPAPGYELGYEPGYELENFMLWHGQTNLPTQRTTGRVPGGLLAAVTT